MPEQKAGDRLLCFDFGLRSIGLATGQSTTGTASPLREVPARDGIPQWHLIDVSVQEWNPARLLVGLPLNMDGTESKLSARARKFGNRLNGRYGLPVEMVDERLSSRSAKEEARGMGHRGDYRQTPVDSVAACLILEQYLNEQVERGQ